MEVILSKAAQLIASLSILIVLHEMGHFLAARYFNTRVERFFLFFDWKFALFKAKIGDTVVGLGWLPLGGYVKISGMWDESMDKEAMAKPVEPWEFRAKPAWQRLIIMIGGVTVNLILGFFIYILILYTWGTDRLPLANMTYGVQCDSVMYDYGFQDGDRILGLEENPEIKYFSQLGSEILIHGARKVRLDRNGQEMVIELPAAFNDTLLSKEVRGMFRNRFPFVVEKVSEDDKYDAMNAGFLAGDSIVAVNGEPTPYFYDFSRSVKAKKEEEVVVDIYRDGVLKSLTVKINEQGAAGLQPKDPTNFLTYDHIDYTFWEAIPAGSALTIKKLSDYVVSLKLLFSKSGATQMGGFGTIGSLFPPKFSWQQFWELTAFLSLILAFMNILPIPLLDGGHVAFLVWEIISGKAPGEQFMKVANTIGIVILGALLLFANGNDIVRLFR